MAIIAITLVVAALLVLMWTGRKSVHTELVVPAPPEAVWAVLMDTGSYGDWNPVLVSAEGALAEGNGIDYTMRQPDGKESPISARVTSLVERQELRQFGGIRGVLTFDHRYTLEPAPEGTRVTQHEEYRGIGVHFWDASWVEPAYARVNEALGERARALASEAR
ncbi:MAG: SRPBCC domain-containing protein [Planctomycetota bacterium]